MRLHLRNNRRLAIGAIVLGLLLLVVATVWGQSNQTATSTIAYSRDNQLRLIDANGDNDRPLWTSEPGDTIRGLDWRTDGGALAFASDLQAACSIYQSDIYTILADGLGLRRTTNSPLCAETADFPTGDVTIQIENQVPDYSAFELYVQGASAAVSINVPPGTSKTVTVKDVADLGGPLAQRIVVIRTDTRWYDPAVTVNVVAGKTTEATGPLVLQPDANIYRDFGASGPSWRYDGSAVGFVFGEGQLRQAAPFPVVAEPDELLDPDAIGELIAWSPITDTVLYAGEAAIYAIEPGETGTGTPLIENLPGQRILGLDWLPDGSGFVFTQTDETATVANLARYDLESDEITPLTDLTSGFLRHPGVSPNGQAVVFERASRLDSTAELWLMDLGSGEMEPLGVIGAFPDWRPQRQVTLFAYFYVPLVGNNMLGVTPTFTPTATPTQTPTSTPTKTPLPTSTSAPPTATALATATPGTTVTSEPTATQTTQPTSTVAATATATSNPPTATATNPPVASPTPSATPANLPPLKNGDFEAGANGDWDESINGIASPGSLVVMPQPPTIPRSGSYVAWLGGFTNQVHRLSQPVTLTGSAPLLLQFYYQVSSSETVCTADRVEVLVNDTSLVTYGLCTAENSTGWEKATVDLAAYVGQSVTIRFEGVFDEATLSSFFVDDVSFVKTP